MLSVLVPPPLQPHTPRAPDRRTDAFAEKFSARRLDPSRSPDGSRRTSVFATRALWAPASRDCRSSRRCSRPAQRYDGNRNSTRPTRPPPFARQAPRTQRRAMDIFSGIEIRRLQHPGVQSGAVADIHFEKFDGRAAKGASFRERRVIFQHSHACPGDPPDRTPAPRPRANTCATPIFRWAKCRNGACPARGAHPLRFSASDPSSFVR